MKKAVATKGLAADLAIAPVDQNSETVAELCETTGMGRCWTTRQAAAQVKAGKWERVLKRVNGRLTPAYRRAA